MWTKTDDLYIIPRDVPATHKLKSNSDIMEHLAIFEAHKAKEVFHAENNVILDKNGMNLLNHFKFS